jgi:hypothetical protein
MATRGPLEVMVWMSPPGQMTETGKQGLCRQQAMVPVQREGPGERPCRRPEATRLDRCPMMTLGISIPAGWDRQRGTSDPDLWTMGGHGRAGG